MAWRRVQSTEGEEIPHLETWQQETSFHGGGGIPYSQEIPMQVDTCLFLDGVHYAGELCPHGQEEYPVGWTV
jgi:hypothetical protein